MLERISHIGILVHDLDAAARAWCEHFGLQRYLDYVADCEGIKACLLSPGGTREEMSIELIEPLDKTDMNNPLARRLAEQGEGFFHLAVIARDVAAAGAQLEAQGLKPIPRPPVPGVTGERWLIHPRFCNGVLVEGV
ncbi:MAG TPA: VOC family protein [Gammaproteobacteria bacterium]|nr:VOC family protein [Gammaproteobacteria bacterium]